MRALIPLSVSAAVVAAAAVVLVQGPATAANSSTCSLRQPVSEKSETPTSCVAADVSLDRLPAVGESATVTVTIRSQVDLDQANLAVRLPDTLKLATGDSGLSQPRVVGLSQLAEQRFALSTKGRTLKFGVTALAAGPAHIEADVTSADQPATDRSAHGFATLTVGGKAGTSRAGVTGTDSAVVTRSAPPAALATTAAAGQICAKGAFQYADAKGAWKPGRTVTAKVVGKTTSAATAQYYATGLTGSDGAYSVCFTSPVTTMYQVWVEFSTDSALWRVTNNAGTSVYTATTAAKTNVAGGTDAAFGTTAPTSANMRGWHAYDTVNKLWGIHGTSPCWTTRETSNCQRKLTIHWQPGSTDGTYFQNGVPVAQRYVALADADPDSEHLVLHESGHALMDMLYAGWWPTSDCPSPHYLHARTGSSCAWTEGFANAIAGYTMGDGMFYWADGSGMDLMTTKWFNSAQPAGRTNVENGDQVECRVAGATIDLWRKVDGGPTRTFASMIANSSSSYKEWFTVDRASAGLDVSSATRDLVYTHTIDYRTSTTTPPTTTVPPTTTPPGSSIVANGGFESGTTGWTVTGGSVGQFTYYPAQAGSWYAWLGGNGQANTDTVSQSVTIPATAGTATLSYYLRVGTAETESTAYDTLKVQVVSGSTATTLKTYSNVDANTGYVKRTLDVSGYRGKTVTLKFLSVEDASLQTDFLVDTVAITTS
ncbi:hypothetical protein [Actinokineospora sp. NBRC 105648]|uniref:hypothetical protein n=1 Tax=Actinokineospora sp. NBRC 105648 TaxID=3032206 RepID=UPI0024A21C1D|nr:hypothetical protein [Actinokineospora sp. NBRC 105648]GLZ40072.1 hypothetical protein Acsp05_36960 [Actinokineospora sp. NBRC 105648]